MCECGRRRGQEGAGKGEGGSTRLAHSTGGPTPSKGAQPCRGERTSGRGTGLPDQRQRQTDRQMVAQKRRVNGGGGKEQVRAANRARPKPLLERWPELLAGCGACLSLPAPPLGALGVPMCMVAWSPESELEIFEGTRPETGQTCFSCTAVQRPSGN